MDSQHRDAARLMMLEAHNRQLSAMVTLLAAENEDLRCRVGMAELLPDMPNVSGAPLEWLRVIGRVWQYRVIAIGERNRALNEVERLTATVQRLEREAQEREELYQIQVQDLLAK